MNIPPSRRYRISQGNLCAVEQYVNGAWSTIFVCKDEQAAETQLLLCIARAEVWDRLTPEQRLSLTLR